MFTGGAIHFIHHIFIVHIGTIELKAYYALADYSLIGASGLSDVDRGQI
jgi:hypothetical protein